MLPPEIGNLARLRSLQVHYSHDLWGPIPESLADTETNQFFTYQTGLCAPRHLSNWLRALEESDSMPTCIPSTGDRDLLVKIYNETGGPGWWNQYQWLNPSGINSWAGIATDEEGYVTEFALWSNGIVGSIPPEVGDLSRLKIFDLSSNNLTGSIPLELANLSNLVILSLEKTGLEGAIPPELGNLSNLEKLVLYDNELKGAIPPELGRLSELKVLDLDGNDLTGSIPPELGNLSNLVTLTLQDNRLDGAIPPELGGLSKLQQFFLSKNRLSGTMPAELGSLTSARDFRVWHNQLTGPIPPEFGQLDSLGTLMLSGNKLSGPIPPEIGKLRNLEHFRALENKLSGPIPAEFGRLASLVELNLHANNLSGPIPPALGNMTSLEWLILSSNRLSGNIPPELGKLSSLIQLSLYENRLTGAIPPELGKLSSLIYFWLSDNKFTGTIPVELAQLPAVEDFGVQNNELSGPIPPELARLSTLVQLNLSTNNISSTLPPELGKLGNLSDLRVADNPDLEGLLPRSFMKLPLVHLDIGGTWICPHLDDEFQDWLDGIPWAYGLECPPTLTERFALVEFYDSTGGDSWTNNDGWDSDSDVGDWYGVTVGDSLVVELRLPENGLAGPLPPVVANLTELQSLDIAGNGLNGGFPVAMTSMEALDTIRIGGNEDMDGPLPFRMVDLEDLKALQFEDTDLCASPAPTFQEWIDSLDVAEGATCENPDSVKLSMPIVYLTQAIQRPEGDVALISDREALLRVFLVGDQENAFYEPEVFATFTSDGEEVCRVVMPSEVDRVATAADEGSLLGSYDAVIPAECIRNHTELVIVADSAELIPRAAGSQTRFPETGAAALDVIDVPPFELTVVPVLYSENPDSSIFEWTDSIDDDSPEVGLFKYSFPFSEFTATSWDTAYITDLDPTDDDTPWSLVLELEQVYKSAEAKGYWYAVADSDEGYVRGVARLNGWVSFGKPWDTELAHEVGHSLNLLHAPCGGPSGTDPDFPYPNGSIGVWGFDFRDSTLVSPGVRRDIMGYCYDSGWLSDYYFEKVISLREKKEGGDPEAGRAEAGPKGQMMVLSGGVLNGELRIEPVHSMYTTATLPEASGPYRLDGITNTGDIEFSLSFTPGEDVYGNKYFLFAIPIEADWEDSLERITLTGPEGEVTVDDSDPRSLTVVTDPVTGRIRAILRDWVGPLPTALGDTDGLEAVTTTGMLDAVRLR